MKAIRKDGYYYDPPSWKVCPECGGKGDIVVQVPCPDGRVGCLVAHYKQIECQTCNGKGRIPIHYTPKEWEAAGGILTDDTPCWQIIKQGSEVLRYMEPWGDIKQLKEGKIIIATSAGKPEEK